MKKITFSILLLFFSQINLAQNAGTPYLLILGIAQDGGYPHAGCTKKCCAQAWQNDSLKKFVTSFALVDSASNRWWLFEATPDIKYQLEYFRKLTDRNYKYLPEGIFITHAHIGHYTGLMQFGREVMSTAGLPVYALPRLKQFLETNGPWSQLVKLKNISLHPLYADSVLQLTDEIKIETFSVPHRDEFSETAGFKIITPSKKYLFIPDIDKWEKWKRNIVDQVKSVDVALLDGTFFESNELPERKISEVPHPFVPETTAHFKSETEEVKSKIFFIHFNHTNRLMWDEAVRDEFLKNGFQLAVQGQVL